MTLQSTNLNPEPFAEPQGTYSLSYIDSVEIQQQRYFTSEFLCFMKSHCRSTVGPEECRPEGGISFQRLWLHQPSQQAIEYLAGKPCKVSRVHVALDVIPDSREAAKELQKYLARTLLPSFRPFDEVTWFPEDQDRDPWITASCYFGFTKSRGPGKTATLYADQPSKITNAPCCHLEVRLELSRTLAANGIQDGLDLLRLDHRQFWQNHLSLVQLPTAKALGEAWSKGFARRSRPQSKRYPYGGRTQAMYRIGHILLRASHDNCGNPNSNNLLHLLLERRPLGTQSVQELFQRLDNSWILPPSLNALWKGNKSVVDQQARRDSAPSSFLSLAEEDVPY